MTTYGSTRTAMRMGKNVTHKQKQMPHKNTATIKYVGIKNQVDSGN